MNTTPLTALVEQAEPEAFRCVAGDTGLLTAVLAVVGQSRDKVPVHRLLKELRARRVSCSAARLQRLVERDGADYDLGYYYASKAGGTPAAIGLRSLDPKPFLGLMGEVQEVLRSVEFALQNASPAARQLALDTVVRLHAAAVAPARFSVRC